MITWQRVITIYNELWQELTRKGSLPAELGQKISDAHEVADVACLLEEIPHTLDQSFEGGRRVEKIVRAMKDFSHPGSDEKKAVDINKILENTITVCKNEWNYVADVETEFAHDLPMAPGLAGELSQVFLNIIVNSAHAIGDITEGAAKGKGTGQGLAIARQVVVDQHQRAISLNAKKEKNNLYC